MQLRNIVDTATHIARRLTKKPPSTLLLLKEEIRAYEEQQSAQPDPAASQPSTSTDGDLGSLPTVDILARCDIRSAAAAAAACSLMRGVHMQNSSFPFTGPFRIYIDVLMQLQSGDDFSDGSIESAYVNRVPLDGSVVCGSDLKESQGDVELLQHLMMPGLASIIRSMGPGIDTRLEEAMRGLKAKKDSSKM